ncbi:phosphoribosylanthranilate isomerase [bacterium]|nr:phosphoribosylanthranilate isomerase [bacterium]
MFVKVCGITEVEIAKHLCKKGFDALGLIFYDKSPRFISSQDAQIICDQIPKSIQKIGVFVNQSQDEILKIAKECTLDYVQLHGQESPEFCREIQKHLKVIKAFGIHDDFVFSSLDAYEEIDLYLLDTYFKGQSGGTGKQFNWHLLEGLQLKKPVLISGGLNEQNVLQLLQNFDAWGLDFNSGLEISPGKKDLNKINQLCDLLNRRRKTV